MLSFDRHVFSCTPARYRELLSVGVGKETRYDGEPAPRTDCDWLGELADTAWNILSGGKRLAQEHIGREFLALTTSLDDGN